MTAIPCRRPKVGVTPHPSNVAGAYQAACHVRDCGWTYNSVKTACQEAATRHRGEHRDAVPKTTLEKGTTGAYWATCACGWANDAPGVTTRTDVAMALDYHLSTAHGLVA